MTMAQKPDTAEVEVGEAITSSLTEIRKKVRNLEKKKTKLDTLRDDVKKSGKPLNEDQAVSTVDYSTEIENELNIDYRDSLISV